MTRKTPEDQDLEERALARRLQRDPLLGPFEPVIRRRLERMDATERHLTGGSQRLAEFASGHEYFGLHRREGRWVFREWAPRATALYLKGSFSDWRTRSDLALRRIADGGDWELELPAEALAHGDRYRLEVQWEGGQGERIPAWARRVVQDGTSGSWDAQVWAPAEPYGWLRSAPAALEGPLLIYETHVGMAQDAPRIGSFAEFRERVLPRIRDAGYNAIQLMALAEHPYYASFGYQVSSFFAASSRFGTPHDLKALVDAAHGMGLRVFMDLVHSHAVKNEIEGLSRFDGTPTQFFHAGERGLHPAWDSRCFDYGNPRVLHYLLSNCRYWLDEYRVDGFRFDGVTSMLYRDHGLGRTFRGYPEYFGEEVDEDALAYLGLANRVVHQVKGDALTIAEDVSGMPGLAASQSEGGTGFDYRFAMGVSDYWIKLVKDVPDEAWPMGHLWHELSNRRHDERTISYAESHDQALVGDQTLMFRLAGDLMYHHMSALDEHFGVARAIALHKMIRLATLATAGHGYLNFMGNEFGHPEWIDFPREGNDWSFEYCRRQWRLADDPLLRYQHLAAFDRDLMHLARKRRCPDAEDPGFLLQVDEAAKVLAFFRSGMIFAFNFHPDRSHTGYRIPAAPGRYRVALDTDRQAYGGFGRQDPAIPHRTVPNRIQHHFLELYLPARSAVVLDLARDEH